MRRHTGIVVPGLSSTRGRLLLATPPLVEPTFDRTVVFMLEHTGEGAVGVVLNRITDQVPEAPLDRWVDRLAAPSNVFDGGPVDEDAFIALALLTEAAASAAHARGDTPHALAADTTDADTDDPEGDSDASGFDQDEPLYIAISGTIGSVDLSSDPALSAGEVVGVRIFRGYAGWGPGQLEGELSAGAWIVLDADPDDIVDGDPDELWRNVLRRQPGRLAWLAEAPDDLEVN